MLTFLSRIQLQKSGAIGIVYMLHHVTEKNYEGIPTNEDLKVSPSFLESVILKYKKLGFDFLSLDELDGIISHGITPKRPFVIFTIDDGYLDNYTNALPIFERQQVPFALFVATDFIDKKAILWWDSLEELIMTHDSVNTADGKEYPCRTYQQRWNSFRYLRERILKLDQDNLVQELQIMFRAYDIDWLAPIKSKGMSWQQVKELAVHPLCTIGGHTVTHPALNKLPVEKARREIKDGLDRIEKETRMEVRYFAYPYGTPNEIGQREYQIIDELGIRMAFMAHQGCINKTHTQSLYHLPRVYFRES